VIHGIGLARDTWNRAVVENKIQPPLDATNAIHCSYLISQSYDSTLAVFNRNLEHLLIKNFLLLENSVYDFWKYGLIGKQMLYDSFQGSRTYNSSEEYLRLFPDTLVTYDHRSEISGLAGSFHAQRIPTKDEMLSYGDELNVINRYTVTNAPDLSRHVLIGAYTESCGEDDHEIYESISFRPTWFTLFRIENISNEPIRLKRLLCALGNEGIAPFTTRVNDSNPVAQQLPDMALKPNQSILIPLFFLKQPREINYNQTEETALERVGQEFQRTYSIMNFDFPASSFDVIGPRIDVLEVEYQIGDELYSVQSHELDFRRVYTMNGQWQCGSCPHLFFKRNGQLKHYCELFTKIPSEFETVTFTVPEGVSEIIIAEIEYETTMLDFIEINGVRVLGPSIMNQGDHYEFKVNRGDKVDLRGLYISNWSSRSFEAQQTRRTLIDKFLSSYNHRAVDQTNILN